MREGVPTPADAVDEFSPTVAPTSRPESSKVTEAATGAPQRQDETTGDPLLGAVLADRYSIERRVGAGGMGAVYVGTHLALNKKIAVKVIQPRLGSDPTIAQRFIQEARAASAIGHEHIVQITDFGATPEGGSFLVMEYLDGEDLSETLRRDGPLPWQRVIHLGEQIAWALAAAHKNGIVHRDIKPANCYRVPREHDPDFIKVLDFGLAKFTETDRQGGESLTHTGMLLGTPGYIAPELYRGLKADHRVDIYALGALMHKLLTGELPPMSGSEDGESMRGLPAPDAVAVALARALRENPDHRWSAAQELAQALRAIPRAPITAPDDPTQLQQLPGIAPSHHTRRHDAPSLPGASSHREQTPVSFSSLVTVERDGTRVRLSLGIPAVLLLVGLIVGLVYMLTARDDPPPASTQPPAPQDMSPQPAPAHTVPPPPSPPPPPPATLTPPALTQPGPIPPDFNPVATPPVDDPPTPTTKQPQSTKGTASRLSTVVTNGCLRGSSLFYKVRVQWHTDAAGAIQPRTVELPAEQPQRLPADLEDCVRTKIKASRYEWSPDRDITHTLSIGKRQSTPDLSPTN